MECADRWCWGGTNSTASRAAVRRCGRPVVGRAVRPSRLARGATARRAVCCPDGFRLRRPSASPLRATRDRARLRAAPGAKVWWLNLLGAAILLCVVWADTTALFLAVLGVGTLPLFAMTAGMNLGIMESVPPGNAPFFSLLLAPALACPFGVHPTSLTGRPLEKRHVTRRLGVHPTSSTGRPLKKINVCLASSRAPSPPPVRRRARHAAHARDRRRADAHLRRRAQGDDGATRCVTRSLRRERRSSSGARQSICIYRYQSDGVAR